MKKILALVMVLALAVGAFGCAPAATSPSADPAETSQAPDSQAQEGSGEEADAPAEMQKLIVQTMPTFNGVVGMYIRDMGWPEEAGLDIEYQIYASGAPANEALAADLWDVGYQGAAYVFGVINNDAKIIGNYEETRGDTLFVRPDSDILSVQGYNPTYPEIYGDPDTLTGKTILYQPGSSLHQLVVEYLERMGVSVDDVNMVPMDYQTGLQTFLTGEADIVALPTPWSLTVEAEHGWKPIATLSDFTTSTGCMVASADAYANQKDALVKYMELIYRGAEELEADHDLKAETIMKWYEENGIETTKEQAMQEAQARILITPEMQKSMEYGAPEAAIADFYASIGNIEPDQAEIFKANIMSDIWEEALAE